MEGQGRAGKSFGITARNSDESTDIAALIRDLTTFLRPSIRHRKSPAHLAAESLAFCQVCAYKLDIWQPSRWLDSRRLSGFNELGFSE